MFDWSQPHHCTYQIYLQTTCRINFKISVSIFFIYLKDRNIKFKNFLYPKTALPPPFKRITFFINFIGKVITSFDISLFDNIYLNYNALHFLCTIWNLWALLYVQSHFHHILIIDGVIKFLSHVSHVTSLIVSTQRTSLPIFMLIGLLFPKIWDSGIARTNQHLRLSFLAKIVNSLNP